MLITKGFLIEFNGVVPQGSGLTISMVLKMLIVMFHWIGEEGRNGHRFNVQVGSCYVEF